MINYGTLERKDNFAKIKNVSNTLLYGNRINNPDVTIVIPVYGFGRYLENTLLSIKNQETTKLNIQIIIGDNKVDLADSDKIINLLKKIQLKNVAYYTTDKRLSQLNNFNNVILLAESEYVAMIHDDDLYVPDYFRYLEKMVSFFNNKKEASLLTGKFIVSSKPEDEIKKFVPKDVLNGKVRKIKKSKISFFGVSLTGIPSCGYFLKKSSFIESGGFNDEFPSSGDAFVGAVMVRQGGKIYAADFQTGYYRIGENISLKLNICQGFVKEDFEFGEDWMNSGTIFRKLLMSFFRNYRYSKNIDGKVALFGKANPEITVSNLDYRKKYKKYAKFGLHNFLHAILCRYFRLYDKVIAVKI